MEPTTKNQPQTNNHPHAHTHAHLSREIEPLVSARLIESKRDQRGGRCHPERVRVRCWFPAFVVCVSMYVCKCECAGA